MEVILCKMKSRKILIKKIIERIEGGYIDYSDDDLFEDILEYLVQNNQQLKGGKNKDENKNK